MRSKLETGDNFLRKEDYSVSAYMAFAKYPQTLDNKVIRTVAAFTFFSTLLIYTQFLAWIVIPLFLDFTLRYIHPKYSILAYLAKIIQRDLLESEAQPVYSPAKRFAVLIGVVMTALMSVAYIFSLTTILLVLNSILLVACSLQAFANYCIGCRVYDILVRMGLIHRNENLSAFLANIQ